MIIRDVVARDGLQGERPVPPARRVEVVERVIAAGVRHVEVAAFVSPTAVPAMDGAADVVAALRSTAADLDVTLWSLVPNVTGAELAVAAGVEHVTITVSASPAYSDRNVHLSVEQALAQVEQIRAAADGCVLDEVISCCFGSPYPGEHVGPDDVARLVDHARRVGVDQVTLADTTGEATPRRIGEVLAATGTDVGLHLHDTRGTALLNAWVALDAGVTRFDTAVGGLGGSPFAPTAGGNLPTESLVHLLHEEGVNTGVDLDSLLGLHPLLGDLVGHGLTSPLARA